MSYSKITSLVCISLPVEDLVPYYYFKFNVGFYTHRQSKKIESIEEQKLTCLTEYVATRTIEKHSFLQPCPKGVLPHGTILIVTA